MNPSREQGALGGYQILYELKAGGMGQVLLGRKLGAGGFERLVAIKTIKAELRKRAELRAMFLDEAKLVARLSHPCIAQVYDFGEEPDGTLFLAMEYVAGVRFTDLARRQLPPAIAARAMAQVCRGLHAAHELTDLDGNPLGVVHRDVTPENLMLTFEGRVKVLDFGIALVRGRTAPVTEYGTIKGKPPYLSPEQIKNQPVDRRTDIFSASVVLHELLTGEPLYQGESVYAIARAIETEDVDPPSVAAGPLPDGLDSVVMAGLGRDPEERFQNAQAMAEALERVANVAAGESLEGFARRELAGDFDEHRAWLREVIDRIDGGGGVGAMGRASGVMTAMAAAGAEPQVEFSPAQSVPPPVDTAADRPVDPGASTADELRLLERAGGRRRTVVLALLLLAAAAAVVALLLLRSGGSAESVALLADAGAELADAGAIAAPAPADAAPVAVAAPMDAAPAIAKRPPKKPPAKKPPPRDPPPVDPPPTDPPPTDPPPADPPPPVGNGFVTVAADPYALVRIDGVEVGTTPIFRRRLAAGKHEVVLVHPDSGAVRMRKQIELADGEHQQVIAR